MTHPYRFTRLFAGALLTLTLCASAAQAQVLAPDLFAPAIEADLAPGQARTRLTAARARAYAADVRIVRLPAAARLEALSALTFDVGNGKPLVARRVRFEDRGAVTFTWTGAFADDGGQVLLSFDRGDVVGGIQTREAAYTIEPLGGGLHALVRLDQSMLPECSTPETAPSAVPGLNRNPFEPNAPRFSVSGSASPQTTATIKVLVAYTPAVATASGNVTALVNGAIQAANDVHTNSDVDVVLVKAHQVQVAYTETGAHSTAISRLVNQSDGYMDNLHTLRNQYDADVVVLLSNENDSGSGGQAAGIGVVATGGFAVVEWDLAIGNFTFAHEIGHLVGGHHAYDTDTTPSPYGHGYIYTPGNWRTVMATQGEGGSTIRIGYWSSPDKLYGGVPMGTASYNDDARVWRERASTVADFRTDTPPPTPLSVSINGPSALEFKQVGTWTASAAGGGGGTLAYAWYERAAGGPTWFYTGVTASTYTVTMGTNDFELRVDATKGTQSASATKYVTYGSGCGGCLKASPDGLALVPDAYGIDAPRPNPFGARTELRFALPEPARVRLAVYDVLGREVAVLTDGDVPAGTHTSRFEAGSLAPGVYVYRFEARGASRTFVRSGTVTRLR